MKIADIKIGKRARQDLGDIESLCASIEEVGLLQPVVVTDECELVAGRRRIEAFKKLGRDDIPSRVVKNLADALLFLKAERDENTCRKDFTPGEAVAVGEALERLERPVAAKRKAQAPGEPRGKKAAVSGAKLAHENGKTREKVAAAVGMKHATYEKAKKVMRAAKAEPEKYGPVAAKMNETGNVDAAFKHVKKAEDEAKRAEAVSEACTVSDLRALAKKGQKFATIYADPPWAYSNQGTRAATGNHYGTMTVDEIAALPIGELAAEQSHLWLWTTNAFLFECPKLFEAWGFEFKSSFIWVKPQMGIGNYLRNSHEMLLLAIKGGLTGLATDVKSWGEFGRTEHSSKPEQIRKSVIERVSPGPRLELFGRRLVDGWVTWGNQIDRGMFDGNVKDIA